MEVDASPAGTLIGDNWHEVSEYLCFVDRVRLRRVSKMCYTNVPKPWMPERMEKFIVKWIGMRPLQQGYALGAIADLVAGSPIVPWLDRCYCAFRRNRAMGVGWGSIGRGFRAALVVEIGDSRVLLEIANFTHPAADKFIALHGLEKQDKAFLHSVQLAPTLLSPLAALLDHLDDH